MRKVPRGLYAITDGPYATSQALERAVAAAIEGGAVMVQYRDKGIDAERRTEEARLLCALCHDHGVTFIVNDDVRLAAAGGANGVHIGKDDALFHEARAQLGPDAIIGVSCYNEFARAEHAAASGADYVAFGSFYPSTTKPGAVGATPDLIIAGKLRLDLPVVAIGGITPENGAALVTAGADLLAVITGVFGAPDIRHAAIRYSQLFAR